MDWFKEIKQEVMDWPAQSPDMNPIENLWHILAREVEKRRPKNVAELEAMVREEWGKNPKVTLDDLIDSMPRRMQAVIEAKGGSTKY